MRYKFAPAFISKIFTPFYDLIVEQGNLGKAFQQKVLTYAKIKNGDSILDVGCGSGTFVIIAKKAYPNSKIVGIDPDNKILQIAEEKIKESSLQINLTNGLAEELPFQSESFDIVVSSLTFHHLPSDIKKQTLKEIFRVLKKNGRFLMADIGKPENLFWKIKFIFDLERIFSAGKYMKDNLEGKLPVLLEESNFTVKEITPRHGGIQFLIASKRCQ